MAGRSYLTAADVREIQSVSTNMHETLLNLANPKDTVQVRRVQADGTIADIGEPVIVVWRRAKVQPGAMINESSEASVITGTVRNYAPWDIQIGDRLHLLSTGETATVTAPAPYVKNGVVRATWTMDQGHE